MTTNNRKPFTLEERLKRHSVYNPETGCLEWNGTTRRGYGRLTVVSKDKPKKTMSASRLSYEVFVGKIPKDYYVCHKCDNRKCIEPTHLFVGTHLDNMRDREAKGRNRPPPRQFSNETIAEIHMLKPYLPARVIGEMFGVKRDIIKKIWRGFLYPDRKPAAPEGEK